MQEKNRKSFSLYTMDTHLSDGDYSRCKTLLKQDFQPPLPTELSRFSPKKPMRPLTAYHIFFQIEREYIIQNIPGADVDSSIHSDKTYISNVPRRYSFIKLSHDWYAGPGKRAKRKHRKSHGKISFLDLSRVVSQRWAELDKIDPETKAFVTGIAKRELEEYKKDMKQYKELINLMNNEYDHSTSTSTYYTASEAKVPISKREVEEESTLNTLPVPSAVTSSHVVSDFNFGDIESGSLPCTFTPTMFNGTLVTPPVTPPPSDLFLSSEFDISMIYDDIELLPESPSSSEVSSSSPECFIGNDVDYSISMGSKLSHHPLPASSLHSGKRNLVELYEEDSICDPLFELDRFDDAADCFTTGFDAEELFIT